jgi:adenylate cyclase
MQNQKEKKGIGGYVTQSIFKILKKRTFKVDIVFVFTALIVATVLLLSCFSYFENKASTLALIHGNFEEEAKAVMYKTDNYMRAAQLTAEITTELFDDPDLELGLDTEEARYLLKIVTTQSQIGLCYYGDEQGNFLQAALLGNEIYLKHIRQAEGKAVTDFRYFDLNLNRLREESLPDTKYDPRERPWYKGAKASGNTYWTEPYIFFENGEPGITVACPVYNKDKTLRGIVAADIILGGLSKFLKDIELSKNGLVFIIGENEQLIAYPDSRRLVKIENGIARNLKPRELKIPCVTEAVRNYEDNGERLFSYNIAGAEYLACFTKFPPEFGKKWVFSIIAPEDDFLGPMKKTFRKILFLSLCILLASVLTGILLARQISRPIEQLAAEVLEVKNFNLDSHTEINSHIHEIQTMDAAIRGMKNSLKAFKVYVPATLVKQLIESGENVTIGGKDRELTLFFSDIADFTSISESIPPKDLMLQLSEYFDAVAQIIEAEKGTVDKFIGDAVMAFWGAPIVNDEHAVMACTAALRCQREIDALNRDWEKNGKSPFYTRIGLHTSYNVVGNMGSKQRMNYTVLGEGVNLASRLEGVNKIYSTSIIISKSTHRYVQNRFICRILDQIAVKGNSQSVVIYELLAENNSPGAGKLKGLADRFQDAYSLYLKREWKTAMELFQSILHDFPDDKVSMLYIGRCDKYLGNQPDDSWNGITRLESK